MKPHVSKKDQLSGAVSSKRNLIARKLKQTTMMTALPIVAIMATAGSASAALDRIPIVGSIVKIPVGIITSVTTPIQNMLPISKWYFGTGPLFGNSVGPDGTSGWHILKDKKVTSLIAPSSVKVGMWGGSLLLSTKAQLENVVINRYMPYGAGVSIWDHTEVDLNNVEVNLKGPAKYLLGPVGLSVKGIDAKVTGENIRLNDVRKGIIVKSSAITGNIPFVDGADVRLNNVYINARHRGVEVNGVELLGGMLGKQPKLTMSNFDINVAGGTLYSLFHVGQGIQVREGGIADISNGKINIKGGGNIGFGLTCYINMGCPSGGIVAYGGSLLGTNSIVNASDVDIITSGKRLPGLSATGSLLGGNPKIVGQNLTVSTNGNRSYGAYSSGSMIGFLYSSKALVDVTGINVATAGLRSYGAFAVSRGDVKLTGADATNADGLPLNVISTSGEESYGLYVRGESSRATLTDMTVITSGNRAHGVAVKGRSLIGNLPLVGGFLGSLFGTKDATAELIGTTVRATGTNAHGIYSGPRTLAHDVPIIGDLPLIGGLLGDFNLDLVAGGRVVMSGSDVYSEQGYGVYSDKATFGTRTFVDASDTQIGGKEGAFRVKANTFSIFSIGANTMNLNLTDGSVLYGRGITEKGKGFLGLFKGKATSNVTLSGNSQWIIDGNSNVTNLSLNESAIGFAPNAFGDENFNNNFNVLAIEKNFSSNNGTIVINTALGTDDSPTDRVIFAGGVSDDNVTNFYVRNRGGLGGVTTGNGIEVLSGATGGTFNLIGDYANKNGEQVVVGGAYAYSAYKGPVGASSVGLGKAPTAPGLLNTLSSLLGGLFGASTAIGVNSDESSYFLRTNGFQAGAPVYEALPQVLSQMNGLTTLQQRVGNRQWIGVQDPKPFKKGDLSSVEPTDVVDGRGFWIRVEGSTADFGSGKSSLGTKYDLDQVKVQAGVDFILDENDNGTWMGGLFAQYGHGKSDVKSAYGDGDIKVDAYGIGGTLTWYGKNDWYVDAQAQANWFDANLKSKTALRTLKDGADGVGYALSIETGKKFDLDHEWTMTPQVQLSWNSVDFDDFHDVWGAKITSKEGNSLLGRAGLSFDRQTQWTGEDGKAQRLQTYVIGNLYYEFLKDGTEVRVSDVSFKHENDQFWGGIGAGISYNWADDMYSVYGNVDARSSFDNFGDTYVVGGTVGFRVKF